SSRHRRPAMRTQLAKLGLGLALGASLATSTRAADPVPVSSSPKYKADVPDSIRTPDTVETRTLGPLRFFDGTPSEETVAKTYDYLDVARAAEASGSPPSCSAAA